MTEQQVHLASLSQDLFRIANFIYTGAQASAERFWRESQRWLAELEKTDLPPALEKIIRKLSTTSFDPQSLVLGERLLTYAVITQSLAYHGWSR
jgi:hypothetical protein